MKNTTTLSFPWSDYSSLDKNSEVSILDKRVGEKKHTTLLYFSIQKPSKEISKTLLTSIKANSST